MRRRSSKVKLNTKLMMDVVGAGLIVRNLPKLINMVVPLDPMITTVASVGGGYMAGVMLKRPDLANAAIAVGIAQFIDPLIDDLLGGSVPPIPQGANLPPIEPAIDPALIDSNGSVSDFIRLNDYVDNPSRRMSSTVYDSFY